MPRYPEHIRGLSYIGFGRYFLTFCTYDRRDHFARSDRVDLVRDQFLRTSLEQCCDLLAYCFMPDHVHLLVEGVREDADLKRFVKAAKQSSGYYFKRRWQQPLWQRYGYEHVLRSEESTAAIARYIVENPVRARLVIEPLDYPHWGSSICSRQELLEYIGRAA